MMDSGWPASGSLPCCLEESSQGECPRPQVPRAPAAPPACPAHLPAVPRPHPASQPLTTPWQGRVISLPSVLYFPPAPRPPQGFLLPPGRGTHRHTQSCTLTCTHTHTHTHTHTLMHACLHRYLRTTHKHVHLNPCAHTHLHTQA